MKTASSALTTYINQLRASPDAPVTAPDVYIITLAQTGVVLAWTNADYPIAYSGRTFSCTGPLISGLKYKSAVGLEVDKQQITIAARPTDLINGAQALQSIAAGAFDGATIERHRVFLTAPGGSVIGGVMLFHGIVSTIDSVGRTRAQITVASSLIVLDYDMPRNVFGAHCQHVLYDSGCGVAKGTYSATGTCGAGSTRNGINWSGAQAAHLGGKVTFTSGANANLSATVRLVNAGTRFQVMYPLPSQPATGDGFTIAFGCDHTPNTCQSRFANLANFRGFPWVPPPEIAY